MLALRFVAASPDKGRNVFSRPFTFWAAAIFFALMATHFAVAKSATQMNADAGIEGVILAGPTRGGPSRPGVSDSRPLSKTAFVVTKDDREVASFTTDDHGKFHLSLALRMKRVGQAWPDVIEENQRLIFSPCTLIY